MQLNYNTTGKTAYIWNVDTSERRPLEVPLFVIIVSLAILTLLLLTVMLPKLHNYYTKFNWDSDGLGLLLGVITLAEIFFHFVLKFRFSIDLYSNIRDILGYVILSVTLYGGIYGAIAAIASHCFYGKCSCEGILKSIETFASTFIIAMCIVVYLFPVLIEAFIYPAEIISTIGFIVVGFASISTAYTMLKWFIHKSGSNKIINKSRNLKEKCCYHLQEAIILICVYVIVPFAVYMLLVFCLSLLRLLLESPTSQLFQILLSIVPPTLAGLGSFMVKKKLASQDKSDPPKEKVTLDSDGDDDDRPIIKQLQQKHKYRKLATEQPDHSADVSNNDYGPRQQERGQPRQRVRSDIQQQGRSQERSSQEMQVVVEVHQDDTSNVNRESNT